MSLAKTIEAFGEYAFDETCLFKKCQLPNCLVVMRAVPETINNETIIEESKDPDIETRVIVNANYAQFRANRLEVVAIKSLTDYKDLPHARSIRQRYFQYRVGKIAECNEYNPNPHIVSAEGIHYFKSIVAALCFGLYLEDIDLSFYDGVFYNFNHNGKLLGIHHLQKGEMCGKQTIVQQNGLRLTYDQPKLLM